jgi:hypothetical protein
MAMITCPECKTEIFETANSCPKCGYNLVGFNRLYVASLLASLLGIGLFMTGNEMCGFLLVGVGVAFGFKAWPKKPKTRKKTISLF